MGECIITKTMVCPHSVISGSKCSQCKIPDELNPFLIFQTIHSEILLKMAKGEIEALTFIKHELASRGIDKDGEWIGFGQARKIWFEEENQTKSMGENSKDVLKRFKFKRCFKKI